MVGCEHFIPLGLRDTLSGIYVLAVASLMVGGVLFLSGFIINRGLDNYKMG